jgi:hypothetical protein
MVKSLKCNELISLLKSHSDLGKWITPHFCTNEFKTIIKFTKKKFWYGKQMQKEKISRMSHEWFFWSGTQKESIFWKFVLDVNFWEYCKCQPIWCIFIDNWLNQFWFSYKFLKSRSWSPKRPLMSRTQMITIFTICCFMTSLDHSLLHVLNFIYI